MAFTPDTFVPGSSMANSSAGRIFSYRTAADNLSAVKAANYFDEAAAPSGGLGLKDGDFILVEASNGYSMLAMAVSGAGAATVAAANDFA